MGGTCVIRGCVPKKLMVFASEFRPGFEDARGYGWEIEGQPRFHWPRFHARLREELDRLEGIYRSLLGGSGVAIHDCRATVAGPHEVRLSTGESVTAEHILVATGGQPSMPSIEGVEHGPLVGRHVPPRGAAARSPDRGWRLHLVRVRLHDERDGIERRGLRPRRADPARLRRRGARADRGGHARARRGRASGHQPPGAAPRRRRPDPHPVHRGDRAELRRGAVRHRPLPLHGGARPGGGGRRALARRRGARRSLQPHGRALDLGHRRRHRAHPAHARGDPRGRGLRRHGVRGPPHGARPRAGALGRVHPARDGRGGPDRGGGGGGARRGGLRRLVPAAAHGLRRAARPGDDEAPRGCGRPSRAGLPHRQPRRRPR